MPALRLPPNLTDLSEDYQAANRIQRATMREDPGIDLSGGTQQMITSSNSFTSAECIMLYDSCTLVFLCEDAGALARWCPLDAGCHHKSLCGQSLLARSANIQQCF